MLNQETIDTLQRLLRLYSGLSIDRFRAHPNGCVWVVMEITDQLTVARLAQWASDAVVDFFILPEGEGERLSPERIRYQLRAEPAADESEPELRVVTLCVCLAEDLWNLGLLERNEVDRLRSAWGF
ncbi:MAG: hypothetical protein R3C18_01185 [Planctomycetaceae bacterium]